MDLSIGIRMCHVPERDIMCLHKGTEYNDSELSWQAETGPNLLQLCLPLPFSIFGAQRSNQLATVSPLSKLRNKYNGFQTGQDLSLRSWFVVKLQILVSSFRGTGESLVSWSLPDLTVAMKGNVSACGLNLNRILGRDHWKPPPVRKVYKYKKISK